MAWARKVGTGVMLMVAASLLTGCAALVVGAAARCLIVS